MYKTVAINQVIDGPHTFPDLSHTADRSGKVCGLSHAGVLSLVE